MIIYKITNLVNNKVYIGQTTTSITERWKGHCYGNSNCRRLRNAIKHYGKDNFSIEQIDSASSLEELNTKESYWIQYYNSVELGYNLNYGGNSKLHSEETKNKMSESRKGKTMPESTRKALAKSNSGRKMPEHLKYILKSINTGRPLSDNHKRKLSEIFSGRQPDDKCKQALVKYNEERKLNPELDKYRIQKMSEALKGHVRSEQSKLKQKESRRLAEEFKRSRNWDIPYAKLKKRLIQEAITLLKLISTQMGEKE